MQVLTVGPHAMWFEMRTQETVPTRIVIANAWPDWAHLDDHRRVCHARYAWTRLDGVLYVLSQVHWNDLTPVLEPHTGIMLSAYRQSTPNELAERTSLIERGFRDAAESNELWSTILSDLLVVLTHRVL